MLPLWVRSEVENHIFLAQIHQVLVLCIGNWNQGRVELFPLIFLNAFKFWWNERYINLFHLCSQAGKEVTTAVSGPCRLRGGKEDFCRWNPEPGLNRSHLTILLPMYSGCQNINSLSKIVATVVWLRYCRYGIQSVLEAFDIFSTKFCLLLFMSVGLYVIKNAVSGISIPFAREKCPQGPPGKIKFH